MSPLSSLPCRQKSSDPGSSRCPLPRPPPPESARRSLAINPGQPAPPEATSYGTDRPFYHIELAAHAHSAPCWNSASGIELPLHRYSVPSHRLGRQSREPYDPSPSLPRPGYTTSGRLCPGFGLKCSSRTRVGPPPYLPRYRRVLRPRR